MNPRRRYKRFLHRLDKSIKRYKATGSHREWKRMMRRLKKY